MNAHHHNRPTRGGVTLVELLVVVTILMMLAAFAIPAIRPLTEGRRLREGVRAIDVFINQVKTRAVVNQRPVGFVMDRMRQADVLTGAFSYQEDACIVLRMVEVPPPYAGDYENSRVRIQDWSTLLNTGVTPNRYDQYLPGKFTLKLMIQDGHFRNGLLKWGDKIQFNHQGPTFTIINDPWDDDPANGDFGQDFKPDADGFIFFGDTSDYYVTVGTTGGTTGWVTSHFLTVVIDDTEIAGLPWPRTEAIVGAAIVDSTLTNGSGYPLWSPPATFQITRQPQPSMVAPLRLPKDVVIDLADSGYYIGQPDLDPSTAQVAEGSDHYPAPSANIRYAFEIFQQASGDYLQAPDAFGRIGNTGNPDADKRGPMILFAPNGAIESVYHWMATAPNLAPSYEAHRVTRPVFLMVGSWERTGHEPITAGTPVRSLAEDQLHNWQDASNIWMAISPHNGMVTSAEVNAPAATTTGVAVPGDPDDPDPGNLGLQMQISRAYARDAQISKGALDE